MNLIWTDRAINDLRLNISYIEKRSPQNALKVLKTLTGLADSLLVFPYAYPVEPVYNKDNVRFIAKWNYKIVYRIDKDEIKILRVFNTRQNPNKI